MKRTLRYKEREIVNADQDQMLNTFEGGVEYMPSYRRNWVYIGVREFEFYAIQSNSNGKTHTVGDINVTGFAYYERIFG